MNPNQQNASNIPLLDRLIGADGLKTDLRVRIIIQDDFYIKLGTTIALVGVAFFLVYFLTKSITK